MPIYIPLSKGLKNAGWTVKIYDNEGPEEPHVTIRWRTEAWRVSLRTRKFLVPPGGRWKDIPQEIINALADETNWRKLQAYWDSNNPHNPVQSDDTSHDKP